MEGGILGVLLDKLEKHLFRQGRSLDEGVVHDQFTADCQPGNLQALRERLELAQDWLLIHYLPRSRSAAFPAPEIGTEGDISQGGSSLVVGVEGDGAHGINPLVAASAAHQFQVLRYRSHLFHDHAHGAVSASSSGLISNGGGRQFQAPSIKLDVCPKYRNGGEDGR